MLSVSARYGFLQAIMFSLVNTLTAQYLLLAYGSIIIAKSGTSLPSGASSIFIAVVQLFATFVTYIAIDKMGRKFLLIISLAGCTVTHLIMAAHMYLRNSSEQKSLCDWIPIISMSIILFMSSMGIVPTLTYLSEYFPTKVRPIGMTFGSIAANIFAFVLIKVYPIMEQTIGLQACFLIFCVSCALGTIYVAVFVEETKGIELNETIETTIEATTQGKV